METNFKMLRNLIKDFTPKHRGWLSEKECSLISSTLHLDEMDVLALRNLRDFTVIFLSTKLEQKEKDYMDICSGITAVIDNKILHMGGDV